MRYLFLLLPFLSSAQSGQVIDTFTYIGLPGDERTVVIGSSPGSMYQMLFCTMNVPDSLVVEMCDIRRVFYIGAPGYNAADHGFVEYALDQYGLREVRRQPTVPNEYRHLGAGCANIFGTMLLTFVVPPGCCTVSWSVKGNTHTWTVYFLQVIEKFVAPVTTFDTIYSYSCLYAYRRFQYIDCERYLFIYADSSIQGQPVVVDPRCLRKGSIYFPLYPEYSLVDLDTGYYSVTISNTVCARVFDFVLSDDYPCHLYAPNAIRPQSGGINGVFGLWCDRDLAYDLFIYDRWGSLVYQGSHVTNDGGGWDGTVRGKESPPAVYAWRAVIGHELRSGDVTILR